MIGIGIDEPREAREEPAGDGWGPSDGGFATSQRQWSLVTIAAGGQMKRESERARARERERERAGVHRVTTSYPFIDLSAWCVSMGIWRSMVHGAW